MMARKLASIQKIKSIEPIANADKLELARILGWMCVVEKGKFKAGDWCVYCEIDSFLPIKPEFEFLRKGCYRKFTDGREGFRIKTIKLRGQISQGLILPLSLLPKDKEFALREGEEVTDALGILLYQPPIPTCLMGKIKGTFPSFMPKTDETRVQVLQDVLTRYKGIKCYYTEKVDGTSSTFYLKDGVFGVCSRNLEMIEDENNLHWKMARKLDIENKLKSLKIDNIAIQGELCGPGIQGNPLKLNEPHIYFFNVFDITNYKYLDYTGFFHTIANLLGLETVPILSVKYVLTDNIDELVKLSIGKSVINPLSEREGIVIRPLSEQIDMQLAQGFGNGRLSFKSINPEYLLKEDN